MLMFTLLLSFCLCVAQGDDSFEYLMFAQQYPGAMCLVQDETGSNTCVVPDQANPWTVHGLWPSRTGDEGPQSCQSGDRKFNSDSISSIEDSLQQKWPNILPAQGEDSLWKHEWEKHGSCAEALPELGNELKYFQKTIDLHDQFDVFQALNAGGVSPSADQAYSKDQIIQALSTLVDNNNLLIQCVKDKEDGKWFLAGVRLCLDKSFAPISCSQGRSGRWRRRSSGRGGSKLPATINCPESGDIFYPPAGQTAPADQTDHSDDGDRDADETD